MEERKRVSADTNEVSQPKRPHLDIPREPSIFNIRPVDDITRYIGDFLWEHCGQENVEIEAKMGVFVDRQTNRRLDIGALTETVLNPNKHFSFKFESDMPLEQHKHFNQLLNDRTNKTQAKDYRGERIAYKHTKETDRFFPSMQSRNNIRVTTDQQTGRIVPNGIIEKKRIADLNVHSPSNALDYRISVNLEMPRKSLVLQLKSKCKKPETALSHERHKDRLSYTHGGFTFDLTQVKGAPEKNEEMRHELEVEFVDAHLLAEKKKEGNKNRSGYVQMVEMFVNNIRLLSQSARRL
ncbi:CYTH-like domain-containing protein [Phycomyces nitens]|nr:CYTH-like domain-containing protein [Phycomyces nitens]